MAAERRRPPDGHDRRRRCRCRIPRPPRVDEYHAYVSSEAVGRGDGKQVKRDSNSCLLRLSLSPGALFTPSSLLLCFQFDCPHLRQAHMEPAGIIPKPFDDAILVELR